MLKAHSYQEGWGLIQTGGYDGSSEDFVDFSVDGENWDLLPTRIPDGLSKSDFFEIIKHQRISQELDMATAR